jgi:hypothetical protein
VYGGISRSNYARSAEYRVRPLTSVDGVAIEGDASLPSTSLILLTLRWRRG